MPSKRRYSLKTKEARQVLVDASSITKLNLEEIFGSKANVEVVESEVDFIYVIGGKPLLFKAGDNILPTLQFVEFVKAAPKIIVDMGAVPFVCKGATIMAPGIVRMEGEFIKGDLVAVLDVKYGKTLALGEALIDAEIASKTKKGPIAKTLHYVGDKIWELTKTLE
jgi:PUA-domain protein